MLFLYYIQSLLKGDSAIVFSLLFVGAPGGVNLPPVFTRTLYV